MQQDAVNQIIGFNRNAGVILPNSASQSGVLLGSIFKIGGTTTYSTSSSFLLDSSTFQPNVISVTGNANRVMINASFNYVQTNASTYQIAATIVRSPNANLSGYTNLATNSGQFVNFIGGMTTSLWGNAANSTYETTCNMQFIDTAPPSSTPYYYGIQIYNSGLSSAIIYNMRINAVNV